MKRLLLSFLSVAFVMGIFTSCDENNGRKCVDPKKCPDHTKERHERRW